MLTSSLFVSSSTWPEIGVRRTALQFLKDTFLENQNSTLLVGGGRRAPLPFFLIIQIINLGAENVSSSCVLGMQLTWV